MFGDKIPGSAYHLGFTNGYEFTAKEKRRFMNHVAESLSKTYELNLACAKELVRKSEIQRVYDYDPAYANHRPMEEWVELVYEEAIWHERI